jgi:hypothetical protein
MHFTTVCYYESGYMQCETSKLICALTGLEIKWKRNNLVNHWVIHPVARVSTNIYIYIYRNLRIGAETCSVRSAQ